MNKNIDIFFRFFRVGALTFGSGLAMLPILERELCEGESPYLTKEQISDSYALSQCVPGVIAINTSILSGYQISGAVGGIIAAFGVALPSLITIMLIAAVLSRFTDNAIVTAALMGVRSGVCALILRTLVNLSKKNIVDTFTLAIFFLAFAALVFIDLNPAAVVLAGAALGVISKALGGKK